MHARVRVVGGIDDSTSGSMKRRSLANSSPMMSSASLLYTGIREYPDLKISYRVCGLVIHEYILIRQLESDVDGLTL